MVRIPPHPHKNILRDWIVDHILLFNYFLICDYIIHRQWCRIWVVLSKWQHKNKSNRYTRVLIWLVGSDDLWFDLEKSSSWAVEFEYYYQNASKRTKVIDIHECHFSLPAWTIRGSTPLKPSGIYLLPSYCEIKKLCLK